MIGACAALAALLLATGCAAASFTAPVAFALPPLEGTAWRAEDIDGGGVLDRVPSTLAFEANRTVAGRAACNRYFGTFGQSDETVQIRPAGLTRMACPPEVMDEERKFLTALDAVKKGRREGDALLLLDGDGRVRLRLTAIPRQSAQ
jgi:heat shock protein HslJ